LGEDTGLLILIIEMEAIGSGLVILVDGRDIKTRTGSIRATYFNK
jgi:hypothetical protein